MEWRVRHDKCFASLKTAFGPPDFYLRKLQEKLDRVERLMTHLVRLQTMATALLRFCLGWCQTQKMPTTFGKCFGGIIQTSMIYEACLRAQASIKKRESSIRDPVLHSLAFCPPAAARPPSATAFGTLAGGRSLAPRRVGMVPELRFQLVLGTVRKQASR